MLMLTTKEYSDYTGIKLSTVKDRLKKGKIKNTFEVIGKSNCREYRIPITELNEYQQRRYYKDHSKESAMDIIPTKADAKPFDHYSAEEREEIVFWKQILEEWQSFRNKQTVKSKAEADEDFVKYCSVQYSEARISVDILYRKYSAWKNNDLDGLVDKRGKHRKGATKIPDLAWDAYLSFYLDEAQHPVKRCYEYTKLYLKETAPELVPELPHYSTFYRRTQNDIAEGVKVLGREGEKAFKDRCAPFIKRVYDNMTANEWWIADNHTFDVITMGENGKTHRLYLTAFFDARSGIFTGCHVTLNPSSQATLIALRKGILKYGLPENIYVDNGREFLTHDVGGLGHRAKKPKNNPDRYDPPPIFERLGIKMTNALVRNAKAKIIERRFCDIKNQLSRLFDTYVGGNVVERPEKLKKVLKDGKITLDAEFIEMVDTLLEWHFNQQEYGGAVIEDRGKPRMQVFNEQLHKKRVASAEELNLMLLRSARAQKVTRRGVHLTIGGQRIDYWNDDLLATMLGKQVYFRYDPDDLSEVRIYDLEDRYIMSVPADNEAVCKYGASQEEVKNAISKTKKFEKLTKEALKVAGMPAFGRRTAMELVLADAYENKEAKIIPPANPAVYEMQRAVEEPLFKKAVGDIDFGLMSMNAQRKKQGGVHYE